MIKFILAEVILCMMVCVQACIIEESSITFGEKLSDITKHELLVSKVVATTECLKEPILKLESTTGEKVEIKPFKAEPYVFDSSDTLNYSRTAYFFSLEDIALDREYHWSVQATNQIGPYTFKYRDKSEYNRFDYFVISNVDASNKSLELFKHLEGTDWTQYDALIMNGNVAFNIEDSNGFVGDSFFKNLAPITSHIPFLIQAGPKDMKDGSNLLHYRFKMPGRSSKFGNNLYHFMQGSAKMVFINPNYFVLLNATMKGEFLEEIIEKLQSQDSSIWKIAFMTKSFICYDGEPECDTNLYDINPIYDLLLKCKVSLVVSSQHSIYRKILNPRGFSVDSHVEYNPNRGRYINGVNSMSQIVYGISGNSLQNLKKSTENLWKDNPSDTSNNITLPEQSFLKISIHQLSIEVFLIDVKTNKTVDSLAIFRPSKTLNPTTSSSLLAFNTFLFSPLLLLAILLLPRSFKHQSSVKDKSVDIEESNRTID